MDHTPDSADVLSELRSDYDEAFAAYSSAVMRWRSLQSQSPPDGEAIAESVAAVQAAEMAYRSRRDLLADRMILTQERAMTSSAG